MKITLSVVTDDPRLVQNGVPPALTEALITAISKVIVENEISEVRELGIAISEGD